MDCAHFVLIYTGVCRRLKRKCVEEMVKIRRRGFGIEVGRRDDRATNKAQKAHQASPIHRSTTLQDSFMFSRKWHTRRQRGWVWRGVLESPRRGATAAVNRERASYCGAKQG